MPRLPYNTTCDLIYGASGAHPGVVYASGACRLVPNLVQLPQLIPLANRVAYVDLEFAVPNQGKVTGSSLDYTTDYAYADLVAIPSGFVANFQVLFVEKVSPFHGGLYYRAHLQRYGLFPPVQGIYQYWFGPAQWRVFYFGFGYGPPFDGYSFLLKYVNGSAPNAIYRATISGGITVTLTYSITGQPILTVTTPAATWTYSPSAPFLAGQSNQFVSADAPLYVPAKIYLDPIDPFASSPTPQGAYSNAYSSAWDISHV